MRRILMLCSGRAALGLGIWGRKTLFLYCSCTFVVGVQQGCVWDRTTLLYLLFIPDLMHMKYYIHVVSYHECVILLIPLQCSSKCYGFCARSPSLSIWWLWHEGIDIKNPNSEIAPKCLVSQTELDYIKIKKGNYLYSHSLPLIV